VFVMKNKITEIAKNPNLNVNDDAVINLLKYSSRTNLAKTIAGRADTNINKLFDALQQYLDSTVDNSFVQIIVNRADLDFHDERIYGPKLGGTTQTTFRNYLDQRIETLIQSGEVFNELTKGTLNDSFAKRVSARDDFNVNDQKALDLVSSDLNSEFARNVGKHGSLLVNGDKVLKYVELDLNSVFSEEVAANKNLDKNRIN